MVKNNKFDLIITKEISRFSRNTLDSIKYTRELLKNGVGVLYINDNINTVQTVSVVKDENVFSKDGSGVFYTFLNDFSDEYGINLNIITTDDNSFNTNFNYCFLKDDVVYLNLTFLQPSKSEAGFKLK